MTLPAEDPALDRLRPVYEQIHARLWRAILAWSGSPSVADESVAEAFAQAARRGDAIDDPAAWIWRAAFRIAAGEMAAARSCRTEPLDGIEPPDPAAAAAMAAPAQTIELLRALQQLSDQQRRAVVLTDGAGFSAAEAATLMGTTVGTVRVQASRARHRLRALLGETNSNTNREVDQ